MYSAHRADCVSPPSVRPSSSLGAAMPPFIDPSLARGIRRGYLLALDEAWDRWRQAKTAAIRRNGHLKMPNGKAFQKICAREEKLAKAFLPVDEVTLRSGRRRLWAMLTLKREVEAKAAGDVRWRGMSEAGRARLVGRVLTYPANSVEHTMPVCFSGHAIDRVIQRAGMVGLPLSSADIEAIHAAFAGALIWACAAIVALLAAGPQETEGLCIALPGDHGAFIAEYDTERTELLVKTFIPNDRLWDEERYAIDRLRRIGDAKAALLASPLLDIALFGREIHTELVAEVTQIWRELSWILREKPDRPSAFDMAWELAGEG